MVVKLKGDKNLIKMSLLSEGKRIVRDSLAIIEEAEISIKEALYSSDQILLKKLPPKIKITFKAV